MGGGTAKWPEKLRAFIELGRPMPFPPHVIISLSGTVMAFSIHAPHIDDVGGFMLKAIFAGFLVGYANTASNIYNQVTDLEIDRVNKPHRPIPSGRVSPGEALFVSAFLYVAVIILSFLINTNFALIISLFIFITIMYSTPPILLKKRLWLSNMAIALARGALLPVTGWVVVPGATPLDTPILAVSAFFFFFLLGASGTKDFTDIEGDMKYGMRTLPVYYGPEKAARMISYFFVVPYITIPIAVALNVLPPTTLVVTLLVIWGVYVGQKLQRFSFHPEEGFENSGVWVHMYMMMIVAELALALSFVAAQM